MNVEITTRHCDIPNHLKDRVESRMAKMLRFDDRIMDARVVVSLEKNRYNAEATVVTSGSPLVSRAEDSTDQVALETVLDRMEAQVRKHRDRIRAKRKRTGGIETAEMAAPAPAADRDEEYADAFGEDSDYDGLVTEDAGDFDVKMALAEAVAQLKASRREVLGFTNGATGARMLIFKRRDGNVGVVEAG